MTIRTRLEERLRDAIMRGDTREIGNIVDQLRFRFRANYSDCMNIATKVSGITEGDWEELLYAADQNKED